MHRTHRKYPLATIKGDQDIIKQAGGIPKENHYSAQEHCPDLHTVPAECSLLSYPVFFLLLA